MKKIVVELGERSYPIVIGSGLFSSLLSGSSLQSGEVVMLVTDDNIASIYLDFVCKSLSDFGVSVDQLVISSGESYKSLSMFEYIITELLKKRHNRNVILIAFGGGVIGDLVGFTAATYQRGVRFIQVPTTLLAQVDASIGGKTGVNHALAKNMIGVIYQPISVIINLDFLYTLPSREFSSGLAEVIKYGIAFDSDFFAWLECNIENILNLEVSSLFYCVRRCCELKSFVITNDEHDQGSGVRALLNLGHTYAHAIESYFKYSQEWLHGESVSVGILMAANLSCMLGYLCDVDLKRIRSLLSRAGLPISPPKTMEIGDYLSYMIRDKKNISDDLCLILPVSIGHARVCTNIAHRLVKESIRGILGDM
ncbi:3-dehydroquinate synthase [Blochmannia endosymbiont of Polyrhachis (Hedomyrma) turneri]|uniref:3-dehydroquinate synthase n=1 Tax=Blochmannia endosymbiont of Polyrhachis (Hedomyrma) turneri TaxID=1505596 RepID=UPI00061A662A|nr:3-dehydroquinate synthase [Blochmannia endosymbiont of Polyrhachis (Hedomyrma) turneri]AKC60129.1 3-dehydroquinate synthase [Blochmannia endosymbiont of Polyrhachis (Hedomyrma) turneri]